MNRGQSPFTNSVSHLCPQAHCRVKSLETFGPKQKDMALSDSPSQPKSLRFTDKADPHLQNKKRRKHTLPSITFLPALLPLHPPKTHVLPELSVLCKAFQVSCFCCPFRSCRMLQEKKKEHWSIGEFSAQTIETTRVMLPWKMKKQLHKKRQRRRDGGDERFPTPPALP